jgi:BirA family biotin operon repressor/biotin-[acetyl-CoA-carboxylase] ligase
MVNVTASTRARILDRLRAAAPGTVTGEALGEELGVSRVAVWKQLEALKEAGYGIEADRSGYRLVDGGDFLYPWEFPGREKRVVRYENTDSTMDRALELALGQAPAGSVVVAERQTSGRGRRGRKWNSPRGGLFATLVAGNAGAARGPGPGLAPWQADRCSMAASAALCGTLRELTGEPFALAWPNDIYLGGRKAAGILLEYLAEGEELRLALIGLGVNVANRAPGEGAFSLAELPAPRPGRRAILADFLDRYEAAGPASPGLEERWNFLSAQEGKPVLDPEGRRIGRALGVDGEGRLVVGLAGGRERAFRPGEATLSGKEQL